MPEWFPDLDSKAIEFLKKYFDTLLSINRTLSLISPKTAPFADALHFADCIYASRLIFKDNPQGKDVFDLGSGNGFPGLVYAILYPQTLVQLVESDPRKVEGLNEIVKQLGVKNVNVYAKPMETLPHDSLHFAMTRGLASISKVILAMRKMCPQGAKIYHLKGDEWSMEVAQIPIQLCALWSPALVGSYKLPIADVSLSVVRTDRLSVK